MSRIYNFAAGPSILPLPALEEAAKKMVDYEGTGMSLVEMSHRGKVYDKVHKETVAMAKEILSIPDDFTVLLLQGGATLQFGMIPMAFLKSGMTADYVITGSWAKKALDDAKIIGKVNVVWDGKADNYIKIPALSELKFSGNAAYVHICSNETIGGIQWQEFPDTGNVPLIADMSSEIMSRTLPWDKFSMIYAGAQKNLAPAGMTFVVIRKSFLEKARKDLPVYLRYDVHAGDDSLYNTPPTFSIWMANLNFKWINSIGGMKEIEKRRDEKAKFVYDIIDGSKGYYRCPVDVNCRSKMNIVWRLKTEDLENSFISQAEKAGLSGLKGHRSVGGCRASIYNAMPVEGAKALADFMNDFMKKNG
ncbi:MAG: 3-phosphoserine/phosphohydroxythreonine transaminase [Spirochaetes bacterium]|nr:3-phosphoserine/phosphohydroxythreonine transaminase [Spirochaetota bacterium]